MKIIALLISTLIISQPVHAARTCEDYITDEWRDYRYTIDTISGDNVVTDNKTQLMWKQCSEGLTGADCLTGSVSYHNWSVALDISVTLNANSGFAGFNDWRLPNIEELRSIAAINCFNPAINETAFPNTIGGFDEYWSASPSANDPNKSWIVYSNKGNDDTKQRLDMNRVRLVRSGQDM